MLYTPYCTFCIFSLLRCVGLHAEVLNVTSGDHVELICSDNKVIDTVNITVIEHATECTSDPCAMDIDDIELIERQCNGNSSCDITSNLQTGCLQNYGYLNLKYTCEMISPVSCNFEQGLCGGWSISSNNPDMYWWTTGRSESGPITNQGTGKKIYVSSAQITPNRWKTTEKYMYGFMYEKTWQNVVSMKAIGNYIYAETIEQDYDSGDITILQSDLIQPNTKQCMSFWCYITKNKVGVLNVYQILIKGQNNRSNIFSLSKSTKRKWENILLPLSGDMRDYKVSYEAKRGEEYGFIAIGEIVIANMECDELENYLSHPTDETFDTHFEMCLDVAANEEIKECTKHYIQFSRQDLTFYPRYEECYTLYEKVKHGITEHCRGNSTEFCTLNFSYILKTNPECFLANRLKVEYVCKALPLIRSESQQQNTQSVAVVGGVIAGVVLLTFAAVLLILVLRRSKKDQQSANKPSVIIEQNNSNHKVEYSNDYTGNQNIALPDLGRHVSHQTAFKNGNLQYQQAREGINEKSKPTEYDYTYTDINTSQEEDLKKQSQYEYLDSDKNEDRSRQRYTDENKENGHDIGNGSHYSMAVAVNSEPVNTAEYAVLDPNATGFNRSNDIANGNTGHSNDHTRTISYPTNGRFFETEDPYDVSKDGTYDTSFNTRHKDTDNNIYSHTVDSVYDTLNHQRQNIEKEDTYHHFVSEGTDGDSEAPGD